MDIVERFINYAKIDTTCDPYSGTTPSTARQFDLANLLVKEMKELGMADTAVDEHCFVYGHLEANCETTAPTIGFIAHMDTIADFCGANVKPRVIENYDGKDITLSEGIVTQAANFPFLPSLKGKTLIVTDGTTILGSDDKAGIAEILDAVEYLTKHPEIKHGRIAVAFTPDEEIGTGIHFFDIEKFDAEFAFTLDGGEVYKYCDETFNAAAAKVEIKGVSIHPGSAKDKMVNALNVAYNFHSFFPEYMRPEHTENKEGYIHVTKVEGTVESAVMEYIIRDHNAAKLEEKITLMEDAAAMINKRYGEGTLDLNIRHQYRNMKEIVDQHPEISRYVLEGIAELGYEPGTQCARGGTDGAQLCFRGLPCPNIGTGGRNAHGPFEFAVVEEMRQASELIRGIVIKACKEAE